MMPPPKLTLITAPGHYGLQGWEDLRRWLELNHALCAATIRRSQIHGLTEADMLKVLVEMLVAQNAVYQQELEAFARREFFGPISRKHQP